MGLNEVIAKLKEGAATPQSCQSTDTSQSMSPTNCESFPDLKKYKFTVGVTEKTPYPCRFCTKAFPKQSYLRRHELVHTEHMPFSCTYCAAPFKHKRSRDRHHKLHTGERKYRCRKCPSTFSRSDHLNVHMDTHDIKRPYRCQYCNRFYKTAASLTSHMQSHKKSLASSVADLRYKCLSCPKTFATATELKAHCLTHSQDTGRRGKCLPCHFCQITFPSAKKLKIHVEKMHPLETQGKCPECNETFTTLEDLLQHKKSHEDSQGPVQFSCGLCGKNEFPTLQVLQKHMQETHVPMSNSLGSSTTASSSSPWSPRTTPDGSNQKINSPSEKKFYCRDCTMHFDSQLDLTKHIAAAHVFPGMKSLDNLCVNNFHTPPYKDHEIAQMQEPFFPLMNLQDRSKSSSPKQNHLSVPVYNTMYQPRLPTYLGPLMCSQCPLSVVFSDFESFKEHQKCYHLIPITTSAPYSCHECDGKFLSEELLDRHMTSHYLSSTTEYECQNCRRTFIKPDQLQRHLLDTHAHQLHQCTLCKGIFESKVDLQVHFSMEHSNACTSYKCKSCNSVFRTEADSISHVKMFHSPRQHKFRCSFCNLTYETESMLQSHFLTHRSFSCRFCREEFQIEFLLDQHIREKHPDGASQSLSFSEGDAVQNLSTKSRAERESINSPKRQLRCDMCDTSFAVESSLNAHRRQVHNIRTSGSQKPGQTTLSLFCAYCNEPCKSRTELENHMKTHGVSPRKHKCNICDEICPSAATLAEHKLSHCKVATNSTCVTCHTTLKLEEHFHAHLHQHNPQGLPASCIICRQTLMSEIEVQVHAKHHLKETESLRPCCVCGREYMKAEQIVFGKEANQSYMCKGCYHVNDVPKGSEFRCFECHIKFENMLELERHKSSHSKKYQCIICQQSFNTEPEIKAHVNIHVREDGVNHRCHICQKNFDSPSKLQCHLIEHTYEGSTIYSCYLCSSVFTASYLIQQHMLEHGLDKRPYDCSFCHQKFFFSAELENHSFCHSASVKDTDSLQSTNNSQGFSSLKSLESSSKSLEQGSNIMKCSLCPEKFDSSLDLKRHHFKEHSNSDLQDSKTAFPCPECNEVFPCLSNFQGHMHMHSVGKVFTCPECKKEFSRAKNLTIHMRSHTGEKPYECKQCGKKFSRKENFKAHLKTHTGEKLFPCPHCDKKFARKSHVKEHMRIHITSTTHPCELCSETFPSSAERKRHLVDAHDKNFAYNCSVCNEIFESTEALGQHLLKNHNVGTSRDNSVGDDLSESSLGHTSSSNDLKDCDSSDDNSNMDESDARDSPLSIEEGSSHLENHIPTPQTVA
ncbi:zinc finger protein [Nephila pilipes]|uniref:Zinc finger protein n=1 Tax=Nephila pilipes TaxID=299642 RepID=A0A8X6QU20_NEPPI|nr:zinc finger protein [Nephila pilipes]